MPTYDSKGVGDARYTRAMADTRAFMERHKLDMHYWEGHTNKLYTREAYEYIWSGSWGSSYIEAVEGSPYGISMNSVMAAVILRLHPDTEVRYRKDIKLKHLDRTTDWMQLLDAHSFSIYDSAWNTGVFDLLNYLFPNKSRFEV